MAKLALSKDVLKGFHKLPVKVQKRVSELVERFKRDPYDPAIGLHALKGTMKDPKVRGADLPGAYRAVIIAPEKGDTFILAHIDHHDEAYAWAKNKVFEVHAMTGIFQVFDVEEAAAAGEQETPAGDPTGGYPIAALSDDDLFKAGVPRPLIPAVKAITSDEQLEALYSYLPPDCCDVLTGLAAEMPLDLVLEEMLGLGATEQDEVRPETPGDFSKIDRAPYDLVLVEGEEELKDALVASLEEWRIFLHPCQRKLVEWRTRGPMCINGAAGTGKTVALLHRAVHLAGKLESPGDRVLVTTYTTNLVATLRAQLRRLDAAAAERIDVTSLHALARRICVQSGWRGEIARSENLRPVWDAAFAKADVEPPLPREEIEQEFDLVVDAGGIDNQDAYLTTVRTGRPRWGRKQRRAVWPFFRAFLGELKSRHMLTFEGAVHEARLAAEQGRFQRYAHVLVDEVQDFSLEALRFIRAISPIDEGTPDPLCIVGDGHQRIYRTRVPVGRAGIEIRGRSRRLKLNYRTSGQIRRYADKLLRGMKIDDLDDELTKTQGDRSVLTGPEPISKICSDENTEAEAVVAWVQWLMADEKVASHEICVAPYKPAIRSALESATPPIPTLQLQPRMADPGSSEDGVRMGSMKRIKGLEFRAVAMACANRGDPMNRITEADALMRCERYVVATRARKWVLITLAPEL